MSTLRDIGEFGWLKQMARLLPSAPTVIEGVGDDCAVVRVGDRLLLVSCDLSIENVHFRRAHASPENIGWKAAASALSDIAAMGGAPLFCLVAASYPPDCEIQYLESLYSGLLDAVTQAGAVIIGGDTTSSPDGIALDVTVIGEVVGNRYVSRRGAQPGDLLGITGWPGLAGAGLHALEKGDHEAVLVHAHTKPAPRIAEGQWLAASKEVHAMIDVSDGLEQDAGHLAEAAGLGLEIDPALFPKHPALFAYCRRHSLFPADFILGGGEDYEIAFAAAPNSQKAFVETFGLQFGTPIHFVGTFTDQWQGVRVRDTGPPDRRERSAHERAKKPSRRGYDHFAT